MTIDEQRLSAEQRELVAIGASVGVGCHPCFDHHVKAGAKAGLTADRLLAAMTSGEQAITEATQRMAVHTRGQLGVDAAASAAASPLDEELASFGAALGANDLAKIEHHMLAAVALGVSRSQLQEAIDVAGNVQQNAARIHRRAAERLLDQAAPAVTATAEKTEERAEQEELGCRPETDTAT